MEVRFVKISHMEVLTCESFRSVSGFVNPSLRFFGASEDFIKTDQTAPTVMKLSARLKTAKDHDVPMWKSTKSMTWP